MKRVIMVLAALAALLLPTALKAQPALVQKNGVTRFELDGKPFLILTGEMHNSTSSSEEYMERIGAWEQMKKGNFNTVIASCSWELIEKEEGKFDFSSIDHLIVNARKNGIKIIMLWFASWKNSESTYAPAYVKRNSKKYPLVGTQEGGHLDVLSAFSQENLNADKRAFVALMNHIKAVDPDHTVIMMQVENEMGILGSIRDFSPAAERAWKGQVPADLMQYLSAHKGKLYPELEKVWGANGYKTKGSWEEIFGKSHAPGEGDFPNYTEEIFQAYYYAKYVNEITAAGKAVHNIPMYVNNWLRYSTTATPGSFPSGSPLPEVLDIWRAGAPAVDFSAPDIYGNNFEWVVSEFTLSGNPLFIPECRPDVSKALYSFGEYDAIGFSPFGFDGPQIRGPFIVTAEQFDVISDCYGILKEMDQLIIQNYGSDKMRGVLVTPQNQNPVVEMGDVVLTARSSVNNQRSFNYGQTAEQLASENAQLAATNQQQAQSGALIIQTGPEEFYIVGINVAFSFAPKDPKVKTRYLFDTIEEGTFVDGKWVPERRLNGDENSVTIYELTAVRVILYPSDSRARGRM